jgi:hypothetical protein
VGRATPSAPGQRAAVRQTRSAAGVQAGMCRGVEGSEDSRGVGTFRPRRDPIHLNYAPAVAITVKNPLEMCFDTMGVCHDDFQAGLRTWDRLAQHVGTQG